MEKCIANGGPSALFAVLYHFSNNNPVFVLAFVGSISFALSDTVATEVGLLGQAKPRSIITGKKIDTGQSGGVTLQGEIAVTNLFIVYIKHLRPSVVTGRTTFCVYYIFIRCHSRYDIH